MRFRSSSAALLVVTLACAPLFTACGADDATGGDATGGSASDPADVSGPSRALGEPHRGQYNLGPVEWSGSFWNSYGPYTPDIEALEGEKLVGVSAAFGADGALADACVAISTDKGHSVVGRVVTNGVSKDDNDVDVSQSIFSEIDEGEYPRGMEWQLVRCPTGEALRFQFQTGAHVDWTSLWVRNPAVPVAKVEVQSTKHASFAPLRRSGDGTYTDDGGFGAGAFTIRVTSVDGNVVDSQFAGFRGGDILIKSNNLP